MSVIAILQQPLLPNTYCNSLLMWAPVHLELREMYLRDGRLFCEESCGPVRKSHTSLFPARLSMGRAGFSSVVSEHNGRRVVTTGSHGGYVQRSYVNRGGHSYYARTSYDHGVARSGVYRGYSYGGHSYYGYQPLSYYSPAFYGWAVNPWPGPVDWGVGAWGWGNAPWFGLLRLRTLSVLCWANACGAAEAEAAPFQNKNLYLKCTIFISIVRA